MKGTYQFCESVDLDEFKVVDHNVTMNFHPRHGSVIPITSSEMKTLIDHWGVTDN